MWPREEKLSREEGLGGGGEESSALDNSTIKKEADGLAPETQIWGALLSFCSVTKQSGTRGGKRWVTHSVLAETLARLSGTLLRQTSTQNVCDLLQHALCTLQLRGLSTQMQRCSAKCCKVFNELSSCRQPFWRLPSLTEVSLAEEWKRKPVRVNKLAKWLKDGSLTSKPSISFVMCSILVQIDCCFKKCVCVFVFVCVCVRFNYWTARSILLWQIFTMMC